MTASERQRAYRLRRQMRSIDISDDVLGKIQVLRDRTGWSSDIVLAGALGLFADSLDLVARPLSEWHEDDGPVLWWKFPIQEAPYVGTPLDLGRTMRVRICCGRSDNEIELTHDEPGGGWPGYHTHWTPLPPEPEEPQAPPKPQGDLEA